jgi:hypothetical protein
MPLGSLSKDSSYKYDLGTYDAKTNLVYVPKAGSTNATEVSYTSWYWVRETAKRICYNIANGSGILNGTASSLGYVNTLFTDVTVSGSVGTEISKNLASTDIDTIFGATGYTITASNLPDGLSIEDGKLVGTPTVGGDYTVDLTLVGNYGLGYIKGTAKLNLSIQSAIYLNSADAKKTFSYGKSDVTITVNQKAVTLDKNNYVANGEEKEENVGKYISVTYTATGLPDGLTIDASTGKITGTPKVVGDYDVVVTVTFAKVVEQTQQAGGPNDMNMQMPSGDQQQGQQQGGDQQQGQQQGGDQQQGGGGDPFGATTTYTSEKTSYSTTIKISIDKTSGYNVTFDSNGGDTTNQIFGNANGATTTVSELKVNKPTRAGGYTFLGWATTKDATEGTTDLTTFGDVTEATTYYAVWEAPAVQIVNGHWYINGSDTGISATGAAGANGENGADGADGADGVSVSAFSIAESTDEYTKYLFTFSDGSTYDFTVYNGTNGTDGKEGASVTGEKGEKGDKGDAGETVNATAGLALAIVALVAALAAGGVVVYVLLKKKN